MVIDEAYYGFYKKTYLKLIKTYKNIIILRTFSKSYGLAGLRAGFIACNKATAKICLNSDRCMKLTQFLALL